MHQKVCPKHLSLTPFSHSISTPLIIIQISLKLLDKRKLMALLSRSLTIQLLLLLLVAVLLLCNMSLSSFCEASTTTTTTTNDDDDNKLEQKLKEEVGIKCGSCPCVNPCAPPPPPPPPKNCNPSPLPPPPPRFIYVTGIPGVYQTDQNGWDYYFSGGGRNVDVAAAGSRMLLVGIYWFFF